jgi:hypothetical protein
VNIDRALRDGELIPKRQRHVVEAMLGHGDARVREYATSVIERDTLVRRELAECYREDERMLSERFLPDELAIADEVDPSSTPEDIPF